MLLPTVLGGEGGFSHRHGDIAWVFKSIKQYYSRQADAAMENGVKGHSAGRGGCTHMQYNASITLWHTFFFFLLCTWTQFHPPSHFPKVILIMGGSNSALPGRPQELLLCARANPPLRTSRWSEMETPHLVTAGISGEVAVADKIYTVCVSGTV